MTPSEFFAVTLRSPIFFCGAAIYVCWVIWAICIWACRHVEAQESLKRLLRKVTVWAEVATFLALIGTGYAVSNAIFDYAGASNRSAKETEEANIPHLAHRIALLGNCWYPLPENARQSGIRLSEICAIASAAKEVSKPDFELSIWMGRIEEEKKRWRANTPEYKALVELYGALEKWEKSGAKVRLNDWMQSQLKVNEGFPWMLYLALFSALSACALKIGKAFAELRYVR